MKVDYEPDERRRWKYPWKAMREVGDYFDIPPNSPHQQKGIRNSAWMQTQRRGVVFRTFTLEDGTLRVMVVDIEPGATLA